MSCLRRSSRRNREISKSAIPDYPRVFRDDPLPIVAGIIPDLCIGTAMLLGHDIVADREPQTGPLTTRLGREERLEKLALDVGRDPNAVEDVLNLAYHGHRTQDQSFNITLERDYIAALAPIELVPQDNQAIETDTPALVQSPLTNSATSCLRSEPKGA